MYLTLKIKVICVRTRSNLLALYFAILWFVIKLDLDGYYSRRGRQFLKNYTQKEAMELNLRPNFDSMYSDVITLIYFLFHFYAKVQVRKKKHKLFILFLLL